MLYWRILAVTYCASSLVSCPVSGVYTYPVQCQVFTGTPVQCQVFADTPVQCQVFAGTPVQCQVFAGTPVQCQVFEVISLLGRWLSIFPKE